MGYFDDWMKARRAMEDKAKGKDVTPTYQDPTRNKLMQDSEDAALSEEELKKKYPNRYKSLENGFKYK